MTADARITSGSTANSGRHGDHTQHVDERVDRKAIQRLAQGLSGRLLTPSDRGYHAARRVFNAMVDRHPALIVRCVNTDDVRRCVEFARETGLPLSVKSGGHGVAGRAVCDGGLLVELSRMKRCRVDRAGRLVTAQPGLTLGELDRETQGYDLAVPTGVMSGTGLAGLALGGGLGWLNGKHGLTCDNLAGAEVVTSTGDVLTASASEHPDLFWGLRGAGANFGVVTSFEFNLHRVDRVLAGALSYPSARAASVMRLYRELTADAPDELSANASLSLTPAGELSASVGVCIAGRFEECERLLAPLLRLGAQSDAVQPMPYLMLQRLPDPGFPPGQQHYWRSGHVIEISDGLIETMIEHVLRMPSRASGIGLQQLHGAAGRVAPDATAFAHRGDRYDCLVLSQWSDPRDAERNIGWTRELFAAIEPFLAAGVYVNNLTDDEGANRVRHAYGDNHERLVAVKTAYDPTNFFASNQNIVVVGG